MNEGQSPTRDTLLPHDILETVSAFQKSRVLLTAYELDLFTAVGSGSRTSSEVARVIGTDGHATERLMNALCAIGLLEKRNGRFSNAPLASRFLVRGKPDFMIGLMHSVHKWESWSTLSEAVRRGKSVIPRAGGKRGEDWLQAFIAAMHWRGSLQAPSVVSRLDLSGVSRVLDVGGGSGAYAMAFVQAREGIEAVVFDLPGVIPYTEAYIEEAGLSDKVKTRTGDYLEDDLGGGFDLVFLSAVIHSNSAEENQSLLRKVAGALESNGQIVISDFIMDEDRTSPAIGTLFSLNMLVATESGDTYTESEVGGWLERAGFYGIKRIGTDFGASLMVARKAPAS